MFTRVRTNAKANRLPTDSLVSSYRPGSAAMSGIQCSSSITSKIWYRSVCGSTTVAAQVRSSTANEYMVSKFGPVHRGTRGHASTTLCESGRSRDCDCVSCFARLP